MGQERDTRRTALKELDLEAKLEWVELGTFLVYSGLLNSFSRHLICLMTK